MVIRPARMEDCSAIARIQVDSYRNSYAGLMPADYLAHFSYAEQEQDWRDLLAAGKGDMVIVAGQDSGELLGYALARSGEVFDPPFDGELAALHVRRPHQGQGIGRALLVAAATALQAHGCRAMMLWVLDGNPAIGFYRRLGAVELGRQSWEMDGFEFQIHETAWGWPKLDDLLTPVTQP